MVAPGRAIGDHVTRHRRQTANDGALPHPAVLVHGAQAAQENLVADLRVTAEGGVVGHHHMVADDRVVAHMRACHEQAVGPHTGHARPLRRAAVEGSVLADRVVRPDFEPDRLALVAVVLGVAADHVEGMDDRARPHCRVLLHHHVTDKMDAIRQRHARSHGAPRPDRHVPTQLDRAVDDGRGMDMAHGVTG